MKTLFLRNNLLLFFSFFLSLVFSINLSAQTDPLAQVLSDVHNVQAQSELSKKAAMKVSANPQLNTKLKAINADISKRNLTFKVAFTQASTKSKRQLCGSLRPKKPNAAAVVQQDALNQKSVDKAKIELQSEGLVAPPLHAAVSAGPGSAASKKIYFASAFMSPVKNQGDCGACWAFAACATFEHTFRKFYGTSRMPDVSEQDLINCGVTSTGDKAGSCDGGYSDYAFDYMRSSGTTTESMRPFVGHEDACSNATKTFRACAWGQLYPGGNYPTRSEVKNYLVHYGSVVTYMKASFDDFFTYKSGVYNSYPSSDPTDVDHAVTIVGWNDNVNAWIIKNSWGTDWGYSGYAYVDYNSQNIGNFIYYVYPHSSRGTVSTSIAELKITSPILKASH